MKKQSKIDSISVILVNELGHIAAETLFQETKEWVSRCHDLAEEAKAFAKTGEPGIVRQVEPDS